MHPFTTIYRWCCLPPLPPNHASIFLSISPFPLHPAPHHLSISPSLIYTWHCHYGLFSFIYIRLCHFSKNREHHKNSWRGLWQICFCFDSSNGVRQMLGWRTFLVLKLKEFLTRVLCPARNSTKLYLGIAVTQAVGWCQRSNVFADNNMLTPMSTGQYANTG